MYFLLFQMSELFPATGVYLHKDQLRTALNKSLPSTSARTETAGKKRDGKKVCRYLLSVFFSKMQLEESSLTASPLSKYKPLNEQIINAITGKYLYCGKWLWAKGWFRHCYGSKNETHSIWWVTITLKWSKECTHNSTHQQSPLFQKLKLYKYKQTSYKLNILFMIPLFTNTVKTARMSLIKDLTYLKTGSRFKRFKTP